ncbi:hypothetical protein [Vibrio mangrovi]|uniref:Uncharacterized protein n=1 Tax=Vibrio mangrovi TaxID=474394 RepID=A0A1Y6IVL5_9VIBR|nr:hypothetical protein [Vibrio mangrovi]MDW6001880.1 hypothetical protein [Vibrio mangrovi]SMS00093.1 hypothetical protein VIM7927_01334 [Vibrio mangrovi]
MTDIIKLLKAIEKALKPKPPKQKQKLTPKQFAQMAKVKSSIHLFMLQLATLDRVKDESDKLVQDLVKTFVQQIPQKIKEAESGLDKDSEQQDSAKSSAEEQTDNKNEKSDGESGHTHHSDG